MKALANHALSGTPVHRARGLPHAPSFAIARSPIPRFDSASGAEQRGWLADKSPPPAITAAVSVLPSEGVIRGRVGWNGMAVETLAVAQHGRVEFRFQASVHLLVLLEAGTRSDGFTYVEGAPGSGLHDYQRKLIFVPAGHEYVDWQQTRTLPRVAFFYFDPSTLCLESGTAPGPRVFFEDAELVKMALKLKSAVEGPQSGDRRYREALGVVLAHDLARFISGAGRPQSRIRGGLAAWQEQAVLGYIDERLAEQVSLATLAGLARLSTYHFSRVFKQSFGMPPHRFHSHRRIERAKTLLINPEMSVTQIGMTLGFSSASSFTTTFRKMTGMTPSDFRRSMALATPIEEFHAVPSHRLPRNCAIARNS
jgi:AraC family transcriptional regulator